jgi:hypothetical protein
VPKSADSLVQSDALHQRPACRRVLPGTPIYCARVR